MRNKQVLVALVILAAIMLTKLALLPENTILDLICNILLVIALLSFGDLLMYTLLFLPFKAVKKYFKSRRLRQN